MVSIHYKQKRRRRRSAVRRENIERVTQTGAQKGPPQKLQLPTACQMHV